MSQLAMLLPAVAARPTAELGRVVVRRADSGDEPGIAHVLGGAFEDHTWTPERVHAELTGAEDVLAVYVAEDDDGVTATASARRFEKFPGAGYVHWVGVSPDKRGQRLGRVVVEEVIAHFGRLGVPEVVLETDDVRLAAIATYLGLGFVPEYLEDNHRARWSKVFTGLSTAKSKVGK